MRLCVNCNTELKGPNMLYINHKPRLVKWMKDAGYRSFMPQGCNYYLVNNKKFHRNDWDIKDVLDLGKQYKNCYIYYWAAHRKSSIFSIKNAPDAYRLDNRNSRNDGFTRADDKGRFKFYIKNPQPYKEGGRFYPSHMHFLIADPRDDTYLEKIGTYNIPNQLSYSNVKKDRESILINALPSDHHGKLHIPDSYSIAYTTSISDIAKQLTDILRLNYPKVYKRLGNTLSKTELPITIYCYNSRCDAAHQFAKKLYKLSYFNISLYPGGLKNWFRGKKI